MFGICCENCDNRINEDMPQRQINQCQEPYKPRNCSLCFAFSQSLFRYFHNQRIYRSNQGRFKLDVFSSLVSLLTFYHKTNICQAEKERMISPTNVLKHASSVSVKAQVPSKV